MIITAREFGNLVAERVVWPGDTVLMQGAYAGEWLVRRVQYRLILDLLAAQHYARGEAPEISDYDRALARIACGWSHALIVRDESRGIEMTRPCCRYCQWTERLPPGTRVCVLRPIPTVGAWTATDGLATITAAATDALHALPYPTTELLTYWGWSWGMERLILGRAFGRIFTSRQSDVCSGRSWYWTMAANAWDDLTADEARPEGHYPAELYVNQRFARVAEYVIGKSAAGALPRTPAEGGLPSAHPAGSASSTARNLAGPSGT